MTLVSANALPMSRCVPDFARAIMTRGEEQVARLGKELDPLNAFIVPSPGMKPLLRYEAVVIFAAQIAWRLNKALSSLVENSTIAVVDRSCLE